MGWQKLVLLAAESSPVTDSSGESVTVALIAALGTVAVAVIGLFAQMVSRGRSGNTEPAPTTDPRIGETVAVAAARLHDARSTLNIQDHRLDSVENRIERLEWQVQQILTRRDEPTH